MAILQFYTPQSPALPVFDDVDVAHADIELLTLVAGSITLHFRGKDLAYGPDGEPVGGWVTSYEVLVNGSPQFSVSGFFVDSVNFFSALAI